MPQGNAFRSSSRAQMGSSAITTQNVGGGSKKAGFPYMVGRSSWTSIHFNSTNPVDGHCCKLKSYQMNLFPNARQSRPIGVSPVSTRYYRVPGTGN